MSGRIVHGTYSVWFASHYGPSIDEQKEPTLEEWMSILKLTTMWHFHGLRRTAIDKLTPLVQDWDPIQWIVLARKCDVHEWLLPALNALARRPQALKLHEVNSLGIETVVKMAEVRESFNEQGSYRHSSRENGNFEGEIQRLFADELPRESRRLVDDPCKDIKMAGGRVLRRDMARELR